MANRTIRFGKRYKLIKPHAAKNANSIALRDKSNCQRCCAAVAAVAGVLLLLLQLGQRLKGCRQQCQLSAICTVARCCCSSFGNRLGNRLIVEAVATAAATGEGAAAASPCHALAYITHIRIIQSNPRPAPAPSSLSASSLLERRDVSCCCCCGCCCWQHVAVLCCCWRSFWCLAATLNVCLSRQHEMLLPGAVADAVVGHDRRRPLCQTENR